MSIANLVCWMLQSDFSFSPMLALLFGYPKCFCEPAAESAWAKGWMLLAFESSEPEYTETQQ